MKLQAFYLYFLNYSSSFLLFYQLAERSCSSFENSHLKSSIQAQYVPFAPLGSGNKKIGTVVPIFLT